MIRRPVLRRVFFIAFIVAAATGVGVNRPHALGAAAQEAGGGGGFAARVAAGGAHSLAIRSDGTVWTWGDNHLGQLGVGSTTSQSAPVQVTSLVAGALDVAGGLAHSLALLEDGTVWAWGSNTEGQLGDGTTSQRRLPKQVANLGNVIAVAAGGAHSVALKADGTVWTWGRNAEGQIGDGSATRRTRPVQLVGLTGVSAIAAGGFHTLALGFDATVRAWGLNLMGQLGDGTNTTRRRPTSVPLPAGIQAIAAGASHSLAIADDGRVLAWGWNVMGQLGDGTRTTRTTPVAAVGVSSAVGVSAGGAHSLATTAAGALFAWGANDGGQLGDGTTTAKLTAAEVPPPPGTVAMIAAGGLHSIALELDLSAWSWGSNFVGQLGDGSTTRRTRPVPVSGAGLVFGAVSPTMAPNPGMYDAPLSVVVETETPDAAIHYTTNGADPTTSSAGLAPGESITVDRTTTIKARAFKAGISSSPVVTGLYVLKVAAPTVTPPGGSFTSPQTVLLATTTPDAVVRFTTDGSDPTETSTPFVDAVSVATSLTLKSRAFRDGWEPSDIASQTYVIQSAPALPPDPSEVAPPVDPTVTTDFAAATAFLYTGPNPIQREVQPDAIVSRRTGVVRGEVRDRAGAPLSGVRVSVPARTQLGHTLTRADGQFDLVVNGGGPVTIDYVRTGYLPAQRTLHVPWHDYVVAPAVRLTALDSQVTRIDFGPGGEKVARGTPVTDSDGTRRATLIVPEQGSMANLHYPDGTILPAQSRLSIRATEYTVGAAGPESMPGELPPTSGYTYAVELSADEAMQAGVTKVTFDPPLAFYVENFLGFPVGMQVPAGYYDRDESAWVASNNGRVIGVVSITDGIADLDVTGDGAADAGDDLAALGLTDSERQRVAALYQPGQTLWRVQIPHFTPWDLNHTVSPDNLPGDAPRPQINNESDEANRPCVRGGSIIECQNQTLGEAVAIAGTPFNLTYRSSRAAGRVSRRSFSVEVTQNTVPSALRSIELRARVAGREMSQTIAPQPNQKIAFTWDGRDQYGRKTFGTMPTDVLVMYSYDGVYLSNNRARSFGVPEGTPTTVRSREPARVPFPSKLDLQGTPPDTTAVAGWNLSVHHTYDGKGQILYRGDGSEVSADALGAISSHVTDTNTATSTVGPDGSVYLLRSFRAPFRLERVTPTGQVEVVAHTGAVPFGTQIGHRIAPGPRDEIYVATVRTPPFFTSTLSVGRYRQNGAAESLGFINGLGHQGGLHLTVAADSTVYVSYGDRLYRIGPGSHTLSEIYRTVPSESGIPASMGGLAMGLDGSLYWSEYRHTGNLSNLAGSIHRLLPSGIRQHVGGNGLAGFSPDGSIATDGPMGPMGLAVDRDGSVMYLELTGDRGIFNAPLQSRVRRIGTDGILRTIAGGAGAVYGQDLGDGRPAVGAKYQFHAGSSLDIGPDGNVYVSDGMDHVRKISRPPPGVNSSEGFTVASGDGAEAYEFTLDGRHLRTRNAITGAVVYSFGYGAAGQLIRVTDGDGLVTTIERNGAGMPTAIVGPFGQRTTLSVDGNGHLASLTAPGGAVTRLTTTADGLLTEFKDPNGHASTFQYDELGRLVLDSDAAGGSQALARTEFATGWTATITTALGRQDTYHVLLGEAGDERMTHTAPDGTTTVAVQKADGSRETVGPDGTRTTAMFAPDPRFGMTGAFPSSVTARTPGGRSMTVVTSRAATASPTDRFTLQASTETTAVNGRVYTTVFDGASRTVTTTTPAGRQTTATIDPRGRTTRLQTGTLTPVAFEYDAQGRPSTLTQGSRTLTYHYNGAGELDSVTDPLSRIVSFEYDAASRVTRQTRPDSAVTGFDYDAAGTVTSVTPPSRQAHTFATSPVNLLERYTPPSVAGSEVTSYQYSIDRELEHLARPDGQTLTASYDFAGRLDSLATSTGTVRYTYDPVSGRVSGVQAPGASTSYTYDGPLPTREQWSGGVVGQVAWTFDNNFRVTSETVNGTAPVAFSYDADGLLTKAGALTLERDVPNGLVTRATVGSAVTTFSYDGFGAVASQQTAGLSVSYTRDALSRIQQKTETVNGVTEIDDYTYDLAGRLTAVARNGAALVTYSYDANGNRVTEATSAGTVTATYDEQDRLLTSGTATYTYTAAGELRTRTDSIAGTTTYTYDMLGNLTAVALPDGTVVNYVVDSANRRIARLVNGVRTYGFLFQGQLRPVAELNASGTVVSRFVYATGINVPDYLVRGGVTYRILSDHLGSPRLVVNASSGEVVQQLAYDAFGRVLLDTNPGFQPFGFAGGLYDPLTRLVRFGARDYDAETGKWTAKDPALFAGRQSNLYAYAGSNPTNATDPSGFITLPWFGWVDVGEVSGQDALTFWAGKIDDANASVFERGAGWIGGFFAALWTPCSSDATLATLSAAYTANAYVGRSFWQYYPKNDPGYQSRWLTRGPGWSPPYAVGQEAVEGLALPPYNSATAVREVASSWRQFVGGPGNVAAANGQAGGGVQYLIGGWPK